MPDHLITDGHPAVREVDERIAENGRRKREMAERGQEEQRRYDEERRAHLADPLNQAEPTPPVDLSEAFRQAMHDASALQDERRAVIRRHADEIILALDQEEHAILASLADAADAFITASRELKSIIAERQRVVGIQTPGAPANSTEHPAEPTDVLAAVLADLSYLPEREDARVSYFAVG